MKYDFVVFGATGMQGRIVVKDLVKNGYNVLMCGRDKSRLEDYIKKYKKQVDFTYLDATDINGMVRIINKSGAKVVANCVEGDWNVHILKACIKAGVNVVDLGSDIPMTKMQMTFDEEMKKKGLLSITGCGSVPGIGNVMLRYAEKKFDKIDYIGVGFNWNSNIKKFVVPFSMPSILEEFTSKAPVVVNHRWRKVSPMDTLTLAYHREIGKEPEMIVGHHPETLTFHKFCEKKGVKTIKFFAGFPKHSFDAIMGMVKLTFADKTPIEFKGVKIKPDDFLAEVLKRLERPKGYTENENLWVEIVGKKDGKKKKILMECIVDTLDGWEDAGSNIDTGMPCSIIAQMIKDNIILEKGSFSPEFVVPPEPFFKELARRHMRVYENGKLINCK